MFTTNIVNIAEFAIKYCWVRPTMVQCEIFMVSRLMPFEHLSMKFLFLRPKSTSDGSTGPKPVLNFWG
jgi:hypothetical protein